MKRQIYTCYHYIYLIVYQISTRGLMIKSFNIVSEKFGARKINLLLI